MSELIRTVASEYSKLYQAWREARPQPPMREFAPYFKARLDKEGCLELGSDISGAWVKVEPEFALDLAQFIREMFTDFSVAARGPK